MKTYLFLTLIGASIVLAPQCLGQAPDNAAAPPVQTSAPEEKAVTNAPPETAEAPAATPQSKFEPPAQPQATDNFSKPGEKNLRLNFRNVPLEMVLNYLSDAAGFIIVLETDIKGKVDVWSNQPLNRDEAVDLLNTILNKNGYAVIQNGRTLRVVSREDAKVKDIPVRTGNDPQQIPK